MTIPPGLPVTAGRTLTAGRAVTPERLQRAARRAVKEGIEVRKIAGTETWIASSGSRADRAYVVSLESCSCPALVMWGAGLCKHQAALRLYLGTLTLTIEGEA